MSTTLIDTVQPLHVFAWIVDSGLRDSLKALAHAVLRRVDRETWRWPRRPGTPGGVTVADLADGAGLSRRHAARCLRTLETLGLVQTIFRPFDVSEYALVPEAWRQRAEQHREVRAAIREKRRIERIERFDAWRRAQAEASLAAEAVKAEMPASVPEVVPVRKAARGNGAAPAASASSSQAGAMAPPGWAVQQGRRLRVSPITVFELVGGAAAAILGPEVDPSTQGGLARPVLRLWDGRDRPEASLLVEELGLVARWAQESVHPEAASLRGEGRRGDGVDRSRDARLLCDPARFEERLQNALAHDKARQPREPRPEAPRPDAEIDIPCRGEPPWIPPGQPPLLPGLGPSPGSLAEAWRAALDRLRRDESQDRGAIDIFLAPLRPVAIEGGVVVLAAPSLDCARWIGRHLKDALAMLAEGLGAPVGLVIDPR